jgi:hypothetical protein
VLKALEPLASAPSGGLITMTRKKAPDSVCPAASRSLCMNAWAILDGAKKLLDACAGQTGATAL